MKGNWRDKYSLVGITEDSDEWKLVLKLYHNHFMNLDEYKEIFGISNETDARVSVELNLERIFNARFVPKKKTNITDREFRILSSKGIYRRRIYFEFTEEFFYEICAVTADDYREVEWYWRHEC